MSTYRAIFTVPLEVTVTLDAEDEDEAADRAWEVAQEYLQTVYGNNRDVTASADLDGIGAHTVEEIA